MQKTALTLFSIEQTARILDVSSKTLRRLEKKGTISPSRGKRDKILFTFEEVVSLRDLLQKPALSSKTFSVKEASSILKVSPDTIRRWEREGKIETRRTPGGHRRFTHEEISALKWQEFQPSPSRIQIPPQVPLRVLGAPLIIPRETFSLNLKLISFVLVSSFLIVLANGAEFTQKQTQDFKSELAFLRTAVSSLKPQEHPIPSVLPADSQGGLLASLIPSDLNLLYNSSFEAGVLGYEPKGWSYILTSSLVNTKVANNSIRSGTLALKVEDASASKANPLALGLSQSTTNVINGRNYIFSVNIRTQNLVRNPTLRIGFIGTASTLDPNYSSSGFDEYAEDKFKDFSLTSDSTSDWTTFSFEYNNAALGKYPFVQISNYEGGRIFLDDLTLYEILQQPIIASPDGSSLSEAKIIGNSILYQNITKIGDGSIVVDSEGYIYPTQGLGIGGGLGKADKRFGGVYVSRLDTSDTLSVSGNTTLSGDITVGSGKFLGLGSTSGRLVFTDSTTDEIDLQTANLDLNNNVITNIGNAATDFDSAGSLTLAGDLAVNGGDITSTGVLTVTPTAGSNLNINLSTTGDFAVNTDQLYVDTSTGSVGIGDTGPDAKLEVLATTEQLRLTNVDDTTDARFTVSSTGDLTINLSGSGTTDQLVLGDADTINIGGSGSTEVAYNVIGDSTAGATNVDSDDDLYIEGNLEVDGTIYGTVSGDLSCTNCLDFTDFEDILDLDANLILNQAAFTWTQNFTGTTTTGFSYAANSLTTGEIFDLSGTFSPTAGGIQSAIDINLTNSPSTTANTLRGIDIGFTDAGTLANTVYGLYVDATTANASDTTYAAAFLGGNVGIGTANPSQLLEVSGGGTTVQKLRVTHSDVGGESLSLGSGGGASTILFSNTGSLWIGGVADVNIGPAAADADIAIDTAGRVGIGTSSPSTAGVLTVNGLVRLRNAADIRYRSDWSSSSTGLNINSFDDTAGVYLPIRMDGLSFAMRADASDAKSLTLDNDGEVGIGTAGPTTKLDIDTGSNTSGLRLRGLAETTEIADLYVAGGNNLVISTTAGAGTEGYLDLRSEDDSYGLILRESDGTGVATFANFYVVDAATDYMNIVVNAAQSTTGLVVQAGGNVGIGTTTPNANLHLRTGAGQLTAALTDAGVRTGNFAFDVGNTNAGSGGAITFGNSQSITAGSIGMVAIKALLTDGSGNTKGDLAFSTRNATSDTALTERMRITSNGLVGIGRTPTTNRLEVEGDASKTTAGDWLANSDIRIKTDVQTVENALEVIDQLRPVKFKYTDEYMAAHPDIKDQYYYNFIAQEFQEVFPDSVQDSGDGYLQLDAYVVRPYLVAAVQELNTKIEELEMRIDGSGDAAQTNTDNNTEGTVYSASTSMTVYDVAENYPTKDTSLSPGEVISLDKSLNGPFVKRATQGEIVLGAISEKPAVLLGGFNGEQYKEEHQVAVALSGRIDINVSTENGPVEVGDPLTLSSAPGVAMKSTGAGHTIGRALENYDDLDPTKVGKIMVFVNLSWNDLAVSLTESGDLISSSAVLAASSSATPVSSSPEPTPPATESSDLASLTTRVSNLETDVLLLKSSQLNSAPSATDSATFLTSLNVLGQAVLGDTVINGKLDVGILSFDNLTAEVNAIGRLKLQSLALDSIEFVGGSIEMDKNGNLNIKKGVIVGNDKIRGSEPITVGAAAIKVEKAWDSTPTSIVVTPTYGAYAWISEVSRSGFSINVSSPPTKDEYLNWFAIW